MGAKYLSVLGWLLIISGFSMFFATWGYADLEKAAAIHGYY